MTLFIVLFTILFAIISIAPLLAAGADANAFIVLPE